jgi:hypothetical protein
MTAIYRMPTQEVDYKTLDIAELYDLQYQPSTNKVEKWRQQKQPSKNIHKANKQTQERSQKRAEKYAASGVEE